MKNIRLNPNREHVDMIIDGLLRKEGYCPCKLGKKEENRCPCDEFIKTHHCHCQLYINITEETQTDK